MYFNMLSCCEKRNDLLNPLASINTEPKYISTIPHPEVFQAAKVLHNIECFTNT